MHTAKIYRVATDAAGRWVVTASDDRTARVWERATGRLVRVLRPPLGPGDEGKLYAVAMSPDGRLVAVGGGSRETTPYTSSTGPPAHCSSARAARRTSSTTSCSTQPAGGWR